MSPDLGRRERMIAMYERGCGTGEIAREFSVKPPAVRRSLIRAGVYRGAPRSGPRRSSETEAHIASLAEHVANGGDPIIWGRENGVDSAWRAQLWNKIKRDLGAQAQ